MEDASDGGVSTSTLEISQPDTQFIPQEDDAEILWEVIEITAEKPKLYRVRWAGKDPKTRKPWPMSWVPKHDCTDDLVFAWKRKQAYKKKEAGQKKSSKRGYTSSKKSRGSAVSLTSAGTSRGGSAASSNTAGTKSRAHSNATPTPRAGPSKFKSHSPSKLASTSDHKPSVTVNPNGKRTHSPPPPPSHSLLDDEGDDDSLPEVVMLTETQPRKKRKIEVEVVAATEHEPGISQESHEIRPAGIARRVKVPPVKEEEEEEEEEEGEDETELPEVVKKPETSRARARLRDQPSMKRVPVKPKPSKGKGRAIQISEDENQDLLPAPLRVPAAPPSQPTPQELEERKAQAIAKKKSQLAQALRDRQPSVDRQLPKRTSPSKSLTTAANASLKKPVASTGTRTRKRGIHPHGDDAKGETDLDILPPRKKPPSRQAASSSTVQGDATPQMDLRHAPSTTSATSKPKPEADLKLAQQGSKPVAAPLLSPNALVQLGEFDKWITESERKARGKRRTRAGHGSADATESADEGGRGRGKRKASGGRGEIVDERPIPAPLFADFGGGDEEEVRGMHETVVVFEGNGDGGLGGGSGHAPAPAPALALAGAPAAAPVNSVTTSALQHRTPPRPHQANGVQSLARLRLRQPLPSSPPNSQSLEPQTPKNRKDSSGHRGDSYRHGVVPETEAEESSNNTQSQSQSQPIPQSQSESPPQPSIPGVGSSPAPISTIPELSLVDDGAGGIASASGSGSRDQKNTTTTEAVAMVGGSNRDKLRAEATLPDLNANAEADTNAKASGSRSGSVLQRNGMMTPKLVSRMKPRTPGSMTKLNVGMNGPGKGKAPMLPLVLEDEHHLYPHEDFKNGSGLEPVGDDDGDNSVLHFPSSPLEGKSLASPAFATKTPTASNIDSVRKSPSPALEMPSPTTLMTSTNKLLRPIPVLSPSKFTPHLPPTSSISNVEVGAETDEREVEELVSSIEQFSSPESRVKRRERWRRRIGLRENGSENERSADDDNPKAMSDAGNDDNDLAGDKEVKVIGDGDVDEFEANVRQRGIELAELARRARLRGEREERRREPMKKGITRDLSGSNLNQTNVRPRKEGSGLGKWKYKEKRKEKESEKDEDHGSSLQQDEGWFASALRPIPRWLLGNSGVTSKQSAVQTTAHPQDAVEGKEEVTVEEEGQASSVIAVIDLREEEEESTQDLLMEAHGKMEVVDVGAERDFVVQKEVGKEQGQTEEPEQEPGPPHEPEPMQIVEDVQEIAQTTTADEPPEEGTTHKPPSPTPSKSPLKAGSDLQIVHEELDLVLPPTASTYQPTPEPSPESPPKDGPEHLGAAMALLNAKSLEISKLDAMLLAEQAKTQALSKEVDALQTALVASSSGSRPRVSTLELDLTEARLLLVQAKAARETERNSLLTSIEELKREKQSAQADCDFFRDQYGQASAFVSSVRQENVELEAQAKRAEEQAKTGVEMVKATFVQRVQWLEEDAQTWRRTAQHLIEMDKRTKGEELRRRAAEAPELRKKCDDLEGKNEVLSERLEDLEDEFDTKVREEEMKRVQEERLQNVRIEEGLMKQVELDNWRSETLRLNVELNEVKAELVRVRADADVDARSGKAAGVQASSHDEEIVYRCQWRPDGSNDVCEGLFLSVEELQNHLFSGGHLHR